MQPIKLTLCSINSFKKEQTIDFEQISNGFFGIFGATGSGKSTILDAIMLALYGRINRAKLAYDFISIGSSSAYVKFVFRCEDTAGQSTFLVERDFRKKKEGKLVDSQAVIYQQVGTSFDVRAEGTNNVDAFVKKLLGMGSDEFSKCIALPQGQFADFLKATPSEKTGLISNIFNLVSYGAPLQKSVSDKEQGLKVELAEINGKLAQLEDVDVRFVEEKKEKLVEVQKMVQALMERFKTKNDQLTEFKQVLYKVEQKNKALNRKLALNQQEEDYKNLRHRVEMAKHFQPYFSKALEKEEKALALKDMQNKFGQCKTELFNASHEYDVIKSESDSFGAGFESSYATALAKIQALESLKIKQAQLQKYAENKMEIESKHKDISTQIAEEKNKIESLTLESEFVENELSKLGEQSKEYEIETNVMLQIKKAAELKAQLEIAEKIVLRVDELRKNLLVKVDNCKAKIESVDEQIAENMQNSNAQLEKIKQKLQIYSINVENELKNCKSEEAKLEIAGKVVGAIEDILKKYKAEIVTLNSELLKLKDERQTIKENVDAAEVAVSSANRKQDKLFDQFKAGSNGKGDLQEILFGAYESAIDEYKHAEQLRFELNTRSVEFDGAAKKIEAQIAEHEKIVEYFEKQKQSLISMFVSPYGNTKLDETVKANSEKLQILQEFLQNTKVFEEKARALAVKKASAESEAVAFENQLEMVENLISQIFEIKSERKQIIDSIEKRFGGKSVDDLMVEIDNANNAMTSLNEKKQNLLDRQSQIKLNRQVAEMKVNDLLLQQEIIQTRIKEIDDQVAKIEFEFRSLGVGTENLQGAIDAETRKLRDLQERKQELSAQLEKLYQQKVNFEGETKMLSAKLNEKFDEIEFIESELKQLQKESNIIEGEEIEEYNIPSAQIEAFENKILEYDNEVRFIDGELASLKDVSDSLVSKEDGQELEKEVGALQEQIMQLQSESGKLQSDVERIEKSVAIKAELSDKKVAITANLDYATMLSKLLRGKALAQFICDEYLEEITLRANEMLALLEGGKFTLKYENGDFVVEDNLNGGEVRSACTLSGGETFLISLSLALSISETIGSKNGNYMNFFFLDEGFGTLDSELCDVVISALYKLENHNLVIGVISHIEMLKDRIKNKILVSKTEKDGSVATIEQTI
ncbi:MAG: SMC family ATPase [Clostridia bacterium]|nr:SMC family ATPase [Clostridia bacterium]